MSAGFASFAMRRAINRYPRLGNVSMNRGWPAESSRSARSRFTAFEAEVEVNECDGWPRL